MKIVVVASLSFSLVQFRGALLAAMVAAGHEVIACAPDDSEAVRSELEKIGVGFRLIPMARASLSPLRDLRTLFALVSLFLRERPDAVLAYTQKPIIYAGLAARIARISGFFPMITGLGYVFTGNNRRPHLRTFVTALYRLAIARARTAIFFNRDDHDELCRSRILDDRTRAILVPGSGIDTDHFAPQPLPQGDPTFLLVARLLYDKGIEEYVKAAQIVHRTQPHVRFQLLGPFDPNPSAISAKTIEQWAASGAIEYLGETLDVRPYLAAAAVFVLPSYREGMPRTVVEAMACGRAIITTDAPGCRETVLDGENGFRVPVGDEVALSEAMLRFVTDPGLAARMGARSRRLAEERYRVEAVNKTLLDLVTDGTHRLAGSSDGRGSPPTNAGTAQDQPTRLDQCCRPGRQLSPQSCE